MEKKKKSQILQNLDFMSLVLPRRKIACEALRNYHVHVFREIALRTLVLSSVQESVSHIWFIPHCLHALLNDWMFLFNPMSCLTFLRINKECMKTFISSHISSSILGMTYLTHILLEATGKGENCKWIDISHMWVHRCKHHSNRDVAIFSSNKHFVDEHHYLSWLMGTWLAHLYGLRAHGCILVSIDLLQKTTTTNYWFN